MSAPTDEWATKVAAEMDSIMDDESMSLESRIERVSDIFVREGIASATVDPDTGVKRYFLDEDAREAILRRIKKEEEDQ